MREKLLITDEKNRTADTLQKTEALFYFQKRASALRWRSVALRLHILSSILGR